jgi:hypothetical protein
MTKANETGENSHQVVYTIRAARFMDDLAGGKRWQPASDALVLER